MSSRPLRDAVKLNHSEHIQLVWPGDYVSASLDDQEGSLYTEPQDCCEEARRKRTIFRPQVTVNVFNTSGSTTDGSTTDGPTITRSSTGATASNKAPSGSDHVSQLTSQIAALSEKVEQLSLRPLARRSEIDSGEWTTTDIRPSSLPQL